MNVAIGSWQPNQRLLDSLASDSQLGDGTEHYLYGDDQKRVFAAVATNYDFIVAAAIRGVPSRLIAAGQGVSREAIDKRLRRLGLRNPPGVLGRPKSQPAATR